MGICSRHLSLVTRHCSSGGQGRVRTSVDRRGRQIYSLLLLTTQPPVRSGSPSKVPLQAHAQGSASPPESSSFEPSGSRKRLGAETPIFPRISECFQILLNPLPNFPTSACLLNSFAAPLAQPDGAGEGIRTPDPLITNQMLYQLSYASRCKLTIILTGSHIARETAKFFPGCLERPAPTFPVQIPTVCVRGLPPNLRWFSRHQNPRAGETRTPGPRPLARSHPPGNGVSPAAQRTTSPKTFYSDRGLLV